MLKESLFLNQDGWFDLNFAKPDVDQPCEYVIVVKIKGWYHPHDGIVQFIPCKSESSDVQVTSWREWLGAPVFEETTTERVCFGKCMDHKRRMVCV
jgi:hypothetical protein